MPAFWRAANGPTYCYTCDTPRRPLKGRGRRRTRLSCWFCGGTAFYRNKERMCREAGRVYQEQVHGGGSKPKRKSGLGPLLWEEIL